MIGVGLFEAQVNQVGNVFRMVELLEGWRNTWHNPGGLAAEFRGKPYVEVWRYVYARQYYDFRLRDYALLQFRRTASELSYVYYDRPFQIEPYEEFVGRELGLHAEDVGEEYREEYEQYVESCPPRETVTPVRYDYEPWNYRAGVHPASHVHIGHGNSIRIGIGKIMRPLSFALFVLRQCYPTEWTRWLGQGDADQLCRQLRDSLDDVAAEQFGAQDRIEHILA